MKALYKQAIDLALDYPLAREWPALAEGLRRAANADARSSPLPAIGCQAFKGEPTAAIPAIAAQTCCEIGILLIDDILDSDPRGEYHRIGAGSAANLAVGMFAVAQGLLLESHTGGNSLLAVSRLNAMLGTVARGQALDAENRRDEAHYWQVAHAKSEIWFGTALYLGALCATQDLAAAERLLEFGFVYGAMMQIHDDLNDCLTAPANPDWISGRYPLPILFAELVDHPQRARFLELRARAAEPAALEEAQSILVSCGAISYCVNELMLRHRRALDQLDAVEAPNPAPLHQLLDEVIQPVERLFDSVGGEMQMISAE